MDTMDSLLRGLRCEKTPERTKYWFTVEGIGLCLYHRTGHTMAELLFGVDPELGPGAGEAYAHLLFEGCLLGGVAPLRRYLASVVDPLTATLLEADLKRFVGWRDA